MTTEITSTIEREYFELNGRHYQQFANVVEVNEVIGQYQKECYGVESDLLHYFGSFLYYRNSCATVRHKVIADKLSVSVSTVRRAINRLVDKFIVVIEHNTEDGYRSNRYIIPTLEDRQRLQKEVAYSTRQYDNNFTNEQSPVNTRPAESETVKPQRAQAIKYTRFIRKPKATLSLFTRPKDLKSTASVNYSDKRIKPITVPEHVYYRCYSFYTDDQIKDLYQTVKNRLRFFNHVLDDNMTELIIDKALDGLLKAKRQYKAGRRTTDVHNPKAYVCSAAWHIAINFEMGNDIDDYIKPIEHNGYRTLYA